MLVQTPILCHSYNSPKSHQAVTPPCDRSFVLCLPVNLSPVLAFIFWSAPACLTYTLVLRALETGGKIQTLFSRHPGHPAPFCAQSYLHVESIFNTVFTLFRIKTQRTDRQVAKQPTICTQWLSSYQENSALSLLPTGASAKHHFD